MGNRFFLINNPGPPASEIITATLVLGMACATGEKKEIQKSKLFPTSLLHSWRS